MRITIINVALITMTVFFSFNLKAQTLYDLNTIQKIEITFTQADWDYQMDTAKNGAEGYLMASQVLINGVSFDSVGVKYKGNSSYDSTRLKNPLHLSINEFKNQKYQGYSDIKLSNGFSDPSMIREVLAYQILKNYMHCPLSNFAQVYINGNYVGIYSNDENIDKKFCADHFYSNQGTFFKCNPVGNPGITTKSNFRFVNNDSSSYQTYYELKSKSGWNELVKLCDSVSNNTSSLDNMLDIDRVIWMLAFNNTIINLDSYNGVFAQNHYTYRDNTNHYNPVIWDMNMAFGGFPFAGAGGTSMGTLASISQLQQFAFNNHATDTYWPLINAVHANATYKRKYVAHMRTILNEFFVSSDYETLASQLRSIIDTAVQSDNNKFYSYTKFQQAMDSATSVGSYSVPGIKTLMNGRAAYLLSTSEFSATPPTISSIATSVANPVHATSFDLRATVINTNINDVSIGYRFDIRDKFTKTAMFDDGLHNDNAAGDGIFGVSLTMNGGAMQYYIYAENNAAGMFSPQRAEHEFYTLYAASQAPASNELVINELLSDNVDNERDEYNETEDWVELYNKSNNTLDLSNVYLSDDVSNLLKWKFPAKTMIVPDSYLTIWTDDDSMEHILHTNFNLNKDTGVLFLSNASGSILDSISFQNQTTNVSFGRYPNGTGSFIPMNTTFGAINNNYPLSTSSVQQNNSFNFYPNPASDKIMMKFDGNHTISIRTIQGQLVYSSNATNYLEVNTSGFRSGIYLIQCGSSFRKLIIE